MLNQRVAKSLRIIYEDVDRGNKDWLKSLDARASCSKGCAHCCRVVVDISLVEGLALYTWFLRPGRDLADRQQRYATMHETFQKQSAALQHHEMDRNKWGAPCAFLTSSETCSAYDMRPIACRSFYSFSDPALCRDRDAQIIKSNVSMPMRRFQPMMEELLREHGIANFIEPLPAIMLHAHKLLSIGPDRYKQLLMSATWYKDIAHQVLQWAHLSRSEKEYTEMYDSIQSNVDLESLPEWLQQKLRPYEQ